MGNRICQWKEGDHMPHSLFTNGPVGSNLDADPDDVLVLRRSLERLGYLRSPLRERSSKPDLELHQSVVGFQKGHGLRPDGSVLPGGPTATAIGSLLAESTPIVEAGPSDLMSPVAGRKRRPAEAECDHLYWNVDVPTCRAITARRGRQAGGRCYHTATFRYAACLRGTPLDELPPLDTWNQ